MARQVFTVAAANELLPRLRVVLERLEEAAARAREHHEKLQVLDALWGDLVHRADNPDYQEWHAHRAVIAESVNHLERLIQEEISSRGIRFPRGGLQHGLLDFPTTWEGRWVYLCWQRDEPRLLAWHEITAGFAGRQTITPEQERRMGREDDPATLDDHRLDF